MIRIGDIVRFLNDVGGGRVVEIKGNTVVVEDEDGFQIPAPERECVVVESASVKDVELKAGEKKFEGQIQTKSGDVLEISLAYVLDRPEKPETSDFNVYLVNESNYSVYVQYITRMNDGKYVLKYGGVQAPYSRDMLFRLDRLHINETNRKFIVRMLPFKENKEFDMKGMFELTPALDPKVLVRSSSYKENRYIDFPAFIMPLVREDENALYDLEGIRGDLAAEMLKKGKADLKAVHEQGTANGRQPSAPDSVTHWDASGVSSKGIPEYDLHAEAILESFSGMGNAEILGYQLDYFRKVMRRYYGHKRGMKVVFIHGKGDGILRQALLKTLKSEFPKCRAQDASFREYGYGATMVVF